MEFWHEFQQFEYSSEVLIIVGGLLIFVSAIKIIQSGLRLAFWFLLATVGGASAWYGTNHATLPFLADSSQVTDLLEPGKRLSRDALEVLCRRLDEFGSEPQAPLSE